MKLSWAEIKELIARELGVILKFVLLAAVLWLSIPNRKLTIEEKVIRDPSKYYGYGGVYTLEYEPTSRIYTFLVELDPDRFPFNTHQRKRLAEYRRHRPDLNDVDDIALAVALYKEFPKEYGDLLVDFKKITIVREEFDLKMFKRKIPLIFGFVYGCYVLSSLIVFFAPRQWALKK